MATFQRWNRSRLAGLGLAAMLASGIGYALAQSGELTQTRTDPTDAGENPETIIQAWPKDVKALGKVLIERYGNPGAADEKHLVWYNNGPWLKTILHRDGVRRALFGKGADHLEQVISYQVPAIKVGELASFDSRLEVDPAVGTLTSRAGSESMNFLALNLADDIVKGQRSVTAAKMFYRQAKLLEMTGKSSPYLDGLIFTIRK